MPSFCVVSDCELKYSHSGNVSFHKFPLNNPSILKEWIKFTDRGPNWQPSRWSSICSRHFISSDFKDFLSRKCLKKSAVPSVMTKNNINIDYQTYHLNLTSQSATEDESAVYYSGTNSCHSVEENQEHEKSTEVTICYLCGEPQEESDIAGLANVEDVLIAAMIKKCFPGTTWRHETEASKLLCAECSQLLKVFSEFTDKVMAYQKDLQVKGSNMSDSFCSNESRFSSQRPSSGAAAKELSGNSIFIKQEPVNVKQEMVETSSKKSAIQTDGVFNVFSKFPTSVVQPPTVSSTPLNRQLLNFAEHKIHLPRGHTSSFCGFCDRIFVNNFELETHTCNSSRNRERDISSINNCEIMEIITLNNTVSFIDLAEDEYTPINRVLKMEHLSDFEKRDRVDTDHAYAKRPLPFHQKKLKQEINYDSTDSSQSNVEVFEPSTEDYVDLSHHNSSQDSDENNMMPEFASNVVIVSEPQHFDQNVRSVEWLKSKTCSICFTDFKTVHEYLVHKNKMHAVGHQCGQCRRVFAFKHALINHKRYSCSVEAGYSYYSCKYCGKRFRNRMRMNDHVKICSFNALEEGTSIPVEITVIDEQVNATEIPKASKEDIGDVHIRNSCDLSGKTYLRKQHQRPSKFHQPKNEETHKCSKCGVLFAQFTDLQHHLDSHLCKIDINFSEIPAAGPVEVQSSSSTSQTTNPQFLSISKLTDSVDVQNAHSGKFVCETCGKAFQTYANLKQHTYTHVDEKKFNCSMCPKTFKRLSGLNQHVRGFHYKIKPYCCTVCSHKYALKGDMLRCRHSSMKNK